MNPAGENAPDLFVPPYLRVARYEKGFCRWCGRRLRSWYAGSIKRGLRPSSITPASDAFCRIACAVNYAHLCLHKHHLYTRARRP